MQGFVGAGTKVVTKKRVVFKPRDHYTGPAILPIGTVGMVMKFLGAGYGNAHYSVHFGPKYGVRHVHGNELELGKKGGN